MTLQTTEVSEELVTEAEKESVLPSNTVPELGVMVTVMGGGGGVEPPPPPPPPQAARKTLRARRKSGGAERGWALELLREEPCFERVCERDHMPFANADEGPANARRGTEAELPCVGKICEF